MKFHFYVVACHPHRGLTTMIDVIDTIPSASIYIEHISMKDLIEKAGGRWNPSQERFLCVADDNVILLTPRDLFLFIKSNALWSM